MPDLARRWLYGRLDGSVCGLPAKTYRHDDCATTSREAKITARALDATTGDLEGGAPDGHISPGGLAERDARHRQRCRTASKIGNRKPDVVDPETRRLDAAQGERQRSCLRRPRGRNRSACENHTGTPPDHEDCSKARRGSAHDPAPLKPGRRPSKDSDHRDRKRCSRSLHR